MSCGAKASLLATRPESSFGVFMRANWFLIAPDPVVVIDSLKVNSTAQGHVDISDWLVATGVLAN
jgi:hypothetical protein